MRGALLWGKVPAGFSLSRQIPTAVVNLSRKLEETPLKEQYQLELEKTFIENLNMLYVGFTRPQDRLYIIGLKKDFNKGGAQNNISYLLYQYLQFKGVWNEEQLCYQLAKGKLALQAHTEVTDQVYHLDLFQSYNWTQRLQLKQHANNVFDFATQEEHRRLNRKLHYALSRITVAEDLEFSLRQLVNEGIISTKEVGEMRSMLLRIVQHPQLARYFGRQTVIEKEKEILNLRASRYKPDRIVFDGNGSKVVLLDFKAPPLMPEHLDNLNFYASLFKDLFFAEIECILYYFDVEQVEKWTYVH